jgi:serine/threonine protein kinase
MGLFDFLKGKPDAPQAKAPAARAPEQRRPDPLPEYSQGTNLGDRYVVRGVLGRGGFGVVYSAVDQHDGKPVAIKAMRLAGTAAQNRDFEAELKIWLGLGTHPFIVALSHVLYHSGRLHAVMEYIPPAEEGVVSMFDMITKGAALNDQRIGQYCIQFCTAMKYASERGMRAHRDIKPMNLLVDAGALLKVSDFGLAWAAEKLGNDLQLGGRLQDAQRLISLNGKVMVGTPGFIAPELLQGGAASSASDMFSFGVTLWQLAAGRVEMPYVVPLAGDVQQYQLSLYRAQLGRQWRKVPSIYWPVIERCLQPDPVQRYRDYDQLLSDIKQVMRAQGLGTVEYIVNNEGRTQLFDLVNHGASLSLMGNHSEGLRRLTEALRRDPMSKAAWLNRGNVYSRIGEYDKALADHNKALELEPQFPEALLAKADDYVGLGRYRDALTDVTAFRQSRPNSTIGLCLHAEVLSRLDHANEGLRLANQANQLDPDNPRVHQVLGVVNMAVGRVDDAIAWLDKALAEYPDSFKSHVAMLRALYAKKDTLRMRAHITRVQELYADDARALNNVGTTLGDLGLHEVAITVFQQALELPTAADQQAMLLANIGVAYGDTGQLQPALEYLDAALKRDSDYFLAHLSKARFLYDAGDFKSAEPSYARAYALDKHSVTALMGLSASALANNKPAVACDALDKLLALDPDNLPARYNFAAAQHLNGQHEQAVATLNKILAADNTYARAWYFKAGLLKGMGRNLDAWNASVQACKHINQLSKHERENALKLMHELTDAPME